MRLTILVAALALSGCAAQLNFIDRTDGQRYTGATGGTSGSAGDARATIDGTEYSGTWVFSRTGGSYSLGTVASSGSATAYGSGGPVTAYGNSTATATVIGVPAQGHGLLNLRAASGRFVRCVFDFNSLSNTGIGECQRNDGRQFDLTIKR